MSVASPADVFRLRSTRTPGLDPDTVFINEPSVARCADLWACSPVEAIHRIRNLLSAHRDTVAVLAPTRCGSARHYECGEVTFKVSEDNQAIVRTFVNEDVALAAGYGRLLLPDTPLSSSAVTRLRWVFRCSTETAVTIGRRLVRVAATSGQDAPIVVSDTGGLVRKYHTEDFVLVTPATHGVVLNVQVFHTGQESADPIPLDPYGLAMLNSALQGLYPDGDVDDDGHYGVTTVRDLLAEHAGGFGATTEVGTRVYDCGEWRFGVSSGNQVLLWAEPAAPRRLDLAHLHIKGDAVKDARRWIAVEAGDAAAAVHSMLADFDAALPDQEVHCNKKGRRTSAYTVTLPDSLIVPIRVGVDGRTVIAVFPPRPARYPDTDGRDD